MVGRHGLYTGGGYGNQPNANRRRCNYQVDACRICRFAGRCQQRNSSL
ncbi:MAG: hypothetical protein EOP41_08270 [Sphingobacteriaceae bacterium]|nr:MAG: hypothetical protein EOP41_08270 [Sphingobacteriaceae bacterium]